jgi:hypothetical protein
VREAPTPPIDSREQRIFRNFRGKRVVNLGEAWSTRRYDKKASRRDVGVWRGSYPDFGGFVALGPGFRPHNPGWIRNQHLWIKTPKMSEFKRCDFRFIFYLGNIIPRTLGRCESQACNPGQSRPRQRLPNRTCSLC